MLIPDIWVKVLKNSENSKSVNAAAETATVLQKMDRQLKLELKATGTTAFAESNLPLNYWCVRNRLFGTVSVLAHLELVHSGIPLIHAKVEPTGFSFKFASMH